ncbi:MAG: PKD domain-containing protein [Planctomycetota bacterium]|nr:PKD domain-containing protein [Planctomycetota bacterium]
MAEAVRGLGGVVHNAQYFQAANTGAGGTRAVEVSGPAGRDFTLRLAALEGVYAVDLPRARKRVWNQEAAAASNIATAQVAPYSLSGAGVTVMVRDEGRVFEHPDFGTRLIWAPDVIGQASLQHSTHVAGTIGGTGLADPLAQAMGMAPACTLVSYDLQGDDVAEPLQAKANYGAVLSNHSYGFATGWDGGTFTDNQNTFGIYGTFARNWDQIVLSDGLIMVKAVGNSRDGSGPVNPHNGTLAPDGEYYDTTDASATGKNILVVGGALDGAYVGAPSPSKVVLASSSSGPCDDGRLRPEIVANGDTVSSCNNSAVAGNLYVSITGTSMACAVATGATALLLESYKQHYGTSAPPAPHFVRAVYAQTAADFGRPGPDYLHGFGMLDLLAAVRLVQSDSPAGSRILSSALSAATPERFYVLNSDGVADIKATLCWTDQPGDVLAASVVVNNLDLHLIRASDQAVFFPYVLDPAHPDLPATRAANSVDTIEQLVLSAPAPGRYLLAVRGATLATDASFALASSHALAEDLAPVARISASSTSGMPPFQVTFDGSASSDPDGTIAQYLWSFGDGATAEGPLVQHTYATGSFSAILRVIDNQGASASTSVVIAVDNKPPVAVAVATPDTGLPPLACLLSGAGSHDPDGLITSYAWDFGDGTAGQGAQVSHTYTAPGLYFATLTVTDDGNATDSQAVTVLAGASLSPSSSRFSLNFQKSGYDRFTLSSKNVPISADLVTTAGVTGSVRFGAAEYPFVLDEKGRYNVAPLRIRLVPTRQRITISLSRVSLQGALSSSGATSRDVQNQVLKIPFALTLGDTVAGSSGLPYSYSARKAKTGSGRLVVPK